MRRYYYRLKLFIWSFFNLPKRLFVAETNFSISSHQWPVAVLCRTGTTKILPGNRMFYEPMEYPYFKELLKKNGKEKIFFDVGAHCGYYSLIAAAEGFRPVAFEIISELVKSTQKNFQENHIDGIVVHNAVGIGGENLEFSDALGRGASVALSLDEYAKTANLYPNVIKMDIEGSEFDALRGASEILKRGPAIDLSVHPDYLARKGQDSREIFELLKKHGYKIIKQLNNTYFLTV